MQTGKSVAIQIVYVIFARQNRLLQQFYVIVGLENALVIYSRVANN